MSDEVEKAFPYVLADNARNRTVFASGYRAGVESQQQRIRELEADLADAQSFAQVNAMNFADWTAAQDDAKSLRDQLAARDALVERVRAYAEDRAFHARGHLNTVNSGRIADDLQAILGAAPESVLAEVKAQALEEFATLQDTLMRVHDYVMDDDDWDEHYRCTASLRAGAANYRKGAGQ